jgi:DNA adenine methylase
MPAVNKTPAKPILKWVGGKRQLVACLQNKMPASFGTYIEPFFGGGALFFDVAPERALISDVNPELINLYRCIRDDHKAVLRQVERWTVTRDCFLDVRGLVFEEMEATDAAARTLFLNKTCFNGLYRVNRKGQFNAPFGNNKGQALYSLENIEAVSQILKGVDIRCGDYKAVLRSAKKGDFVFIDPPYLPVSPTADFKRYTKDQFSMEDQVQVAQEVDRLVELGCFVIATNSNHPAILDLYSRHEMTVIQTSRHISAKSSTRKGEDLVVVANGFAETAMLSDAA